MVSSRTATSRTAARTPTHAAWLAAEPFTLNLGAGYFGFFAHTGVLMALEEFGLRPRRVVGASAGAIAGGLWGAGLSAAEIADRLEALRRADFWDPGIPVNGLLKGQRFAGILQELLGEVGVERFEDAPIPLAMVVHELASNSVRVLETGPLEPAIRASAALPVLFKPVKIGDLRYLDGGITDRAGKTALREGERALYHHLPHGSPWSGVFGKEDDQLQLGADRLTFACRGLPRVSPFKLKAGPVAMREAREQAVDWLSSPLQD